MKPFSHQAFLEEAARLEERASKIKWPGLFAVFGAIAGAWCALPILFLPDSHEEKSGLLFIIGWGVLLGGYVGYSIGKWYRTKLRLRAVDLLWKSAVLEALQSLVRDRKKDA